MNNDKLPRHVAIIPDGNGRWAEKRFMPRMAGHKAGTDAVQRAVEGCIERNIEILTIWGFSSENWQRPSQEVDFLMNIFVTMLQKEVKKLHEKNIQMHIIGDKSRFDRQLQELMQKAEEMTANNTGLKLVIAANYGGRWDICTTVRDIAAEVEQGVLSSKDISIEMIQKKLSLKDLPDPDLLIRTSGEQRISNFLLWQLAYTELFFSPVFWPDFGMKELDEALYFYSQRDRRFGAIKTSLTSVGSG